MTGFGPAIVVISFGSLVVDPHTIVPASAVLDSIAGFVLLRSDWKRGGHRYWAPLAVAIVAGSVLGAVSLAAIPAQLLRRMLGVAVLVLGIWFILGRSREGGSGLRDELPERSSPLDRGFTFLGGFLGGLLGISGPPIIWHFGRQFAKRAFRQILIPVFFIAAGLHHDLCLLASWMHKRRASLPRSPGWQRGSTSEPDSSASEVVFSRVVGLALVAASCRSVQRHS
jgi:uncharacterized membrane protein YfcA